MSKLRQAVKKSPFYSGVEKARDLNNERKWLRAGRPLAAPDSVKRKLMLWMARKQDIHVLVETGTYHGGTVRVLQKFFKQVYSIEVDDTLYKEAAAMFKNYDHIKIIKGDSAVEISKVLSKLKEPAVFWLDAHYSAGETGQGKELSSLQVEIELILKQIKKKKFNHVLLLDDARDFWGSNGYPNLIDVHDLVIKEFPAGYVFDLIDGIVRIYNAKQ